MAKDRTADEMLHLTIISNMKEIIAKCPESYASYVADLTLRTIERVAAEARVKALFKEMYEETNGVTILNIEDILAHDDQRVAISKPKIDKIEFHFRGKPYKFSQESIDEWKFVGLSNTWFIKEHFTEPKNEH